jgi:hypothetical protein
VAGIKNTIRRIDIPFIMDYLPKIMAIDIRNTRSQRPIHKETSIAPSEVDDKKLSRIGLKTIGIKDEHSCEEYVPG